MSNLSKSHVTCSERKKLEEKALAAIEAIGIWNTKMDGAFADDLERVYMAGYEAALKDVKAEGTDE